MIRRVSLVTLAAFTFVAGARGDDATVTVGGLVDTRAVLTDTTRSWLDGGLGKTRYGSLSGGDATLIRVSQLSLLVKGEASEVFSAHLQLNVDTEPGNKPQRARVGLIEGFIAYRPEFSPTTRLRVRAGAFFPPVSLENGEPGWTTPYTITTSAANSWIGEEVRATGVETTLVLAHNRDQVWLTGAGFGGNDPAGTLLAWRGWALHDRQTAFGDRLPLPPIPSLGPGGAFSAHARYVEPLREIDGRLGWYAGGVVQRSGVFEVRGLYWDNRGRQSYFDGYQHAWNTQFGNVGVRLKLPGHVEVLGQHMWGATHVGAYGPGTVDAPFRATYALVTARLGRHRLSARYDQFRVEDNDLDSSGDPNDERGHAWTAAYNLMIGEKHRLAVEALRVVSDRTVRASIGLPVHVPELQLQASLRLRF